MRRIKDKIAVTIVELLAVIVIMGIIAVIAVPTIGTLIENQRIKSSVLSGNVAMETLRLYYLDNPITDNTAVPYDCETDMAQSLIDALDGYMSDVPDITGVSITVSANGNITIVDTTTTGNVKINGYSALIGNNSDTFIAPPN